LAAVMTVIFVINTKQHNVIRSTIERKALHT